MSAGHGTRPTVTLTGWKAAAAILALAAFAVFRMQSAHGTLDTQGREALEVWVRAEVLSPILADTARPLAERGAALVEASRVSVRALEARGSLDDVVVRLELDPNPAFPPGTELVRYYRMRYSTLTGWSHKGNATKLSWYLAAF
ncbi:MAG: hypothetical protein AMXMBFR53_13960 [Gemmatimonadota bacterium]